MMATSGNAGWGRASWSRRSSFAGSRDTSRYQPSSRNWKRWRRLSRGLSNRERRRRVGYAGVATFHGGPGVSSASAEPDKVYDNLNGPYKDKASTVFGVAVVGTGSCTARSRRTRNSRWTWWARGITSTGAICWCSKARRTCKIGQSVAALIDLDQAPERWDRAVSGKKVHASGNSFRVRQLVPTSHPVSASRLLTLQQLDTRGDMHRLNTPERVDPHPSHQRIRCRSCRRPRPRLRQSSILPEVGTNLPRRDKARVGPFEFGRTRTCMWLIRYRGVSCWRSEERRVGKECRSRWSP